MLTLLMSCVLTQTPGDDTDAPTDSGGTDPRLWTGAIWSTAIYDNQVRRTSLETGEQTLVDTCESPIGVVFHPASETVLTSCHQASQVDLIDAATATVSASLTVGGLPYWIDHVGDEVAVANSGDGTFSMIDPGGAAVVRTLEVPGSPIAFDVRDDDTLLVADYLGEVITAVSAVDGEVIWQSDPVALPVWVLDEGDHVYVAESRENSVAVLGAEGQLEDRFSVGSTPTAILSVPWGDTQALAVLYHTGDAIGLYDLDDHALLTELELTGSPIGATRTDDGLVVSLASSDELALVDLVELRIAQTLPAGDGPRGLSWQP